MTSQLYSTPESGDESLPQHLHFHPLEGPRELLRRWRELPSTSRFKIAVGRPSDSSSRTPIAARRQASIAWRIGSRGASNFSRQEKPGIPFGQADKSSRGAGSKSHSIQPQPKCTRGRAPMVALRTKRSARHRARTRGAGGSPKYRAR